jgi:N-methylhydantoinase A
MSVVGIDTGGTFCDLVHIDDQGQATVHKSPSTPSDTAQGVFDVLEIARTGVDRRPDTFYSSMDSVALGTTIATNTVVTHSGAKVGLLTTRGHGDMLAIMRVNGRVAGRPLQEVQNYSITDKPAPIVPKALVAEIDERIDYTGEIIVPLRDAQIEQAVDRLVSAGVECIAVSFLWGFLNPVHELRAKEVIAKRHPGIFISLGSALARRLGEYERTEAAVVNAYVALAVTRYFDRVTSGLGRKGVSAPVLVMHSAGGLGTERHSRNRPIATLFSGPAGGIVASMRVAEAAGFKNVICADVGGTTFDVGLIVNGRPLLRNTSIIDQRVMYCPTLDIVSIGAGGGSIARVDAASGRLMVGPQSAGASPGPACYGRGGEFPTTTDANLVLGYMDPDRFLGGRFKLDRAAAENALNRHVAKPLGIEIEAAAAAIFSIVNAKMADLVRKVSVERGHDPRDFVVCAYGGLGPLHAPFYAADLNAKAVMVPLGELSSVFSAYGIAMADILHVHELSCSLREPLSFSALDELFADLTRDADSQLESDEIAPKDRHTRRFAEVRYVGQLNEMMVEVPKASMGFDVREEFERRYVEAFGPGAAWKEAPIEIVALRLEASGMRRQFPMRARQAAASQAELRCKRRVYWPESKDVVETSIYEGNSLNPNETIAGPAVLEFPTTTVVVPPEWSCLVDKLGNLMLNTQSKSGGSRS